MGMALFKRSRRMKSLAANLFSPSNESSPSEGLDERYRRAISTGGSQPAVSAQYYPYFESRSDSIFGMSEDDVEISRDDGLPVPPNALRSGYGSETTAYLDSGRQHHQSMIELVTGSGFAFRGGDRILDFGCSSGRMIRCFKSMAEYHEVWAPTSAPSMSSGARIISAHRSGSRPQRPTLISRLRTIRSG